MAGTKNHDYHLVEPDPWPLIGALCGGILFSGTVMWFHANRYGVPVMVLGFFGVIVTMINWWKNTIHEAHTGYHTPVVQLHLRYGMILFIASEVMFFLAWFWAFFDSAIFPSAVDAVGGVWPPKGVEVLNPWGFPLLNTLILLCSGTTVTWAHHSLIHGNRDGLKLGLLLTILLGLTFTSVQAYEYAHAPFAFKGSIYGSTFFMATGFHGFHVIVGTIFLTVCLLRAYKGDFTPKPGTGISSTSFGCFCSRRSTSGAAGARRTRGEPGAAGRASLVASGGAFRRLPALRGAHAFPRVGELCRQVPRLRARFLEL
jgi:cytochrome c oxidase subunit 3